MTARPSAPPTSKPATTAVRRSLPLPPPAAGGGQAPQPRTAHRNGRSRGCAHRRSRGRDRAPRSPTPPPTRPRAPPWRARPTSPRSRPLPSRPAPFERSRERRLGHRSHRPACQRRRPPPAVGPPPSGSPRTRRHRARPAASWPRHGAAGTTPLPRVSPSLLTRAAMSSHARSPNPHRAVRTTDAERHHRPS